MRVLHAELPCGFMRTNPGGQVLAANPTLATALGYAGVEVFPDRLDALLPGPGRLYYHLNLWPTLSRGGSLEEVYLDLLPAAGALIPMLINITVADAGAAHDWALMRVSQRGRWEAAMLESRREAERKTAEAARVSAELARALEELTESNWMLRKVAEVLPTCMYCGQVKAGERGWQTAADYLKRNAQFLSHGCCPACAARMRREMGEPDGGG